MTIKLHDLRPAPGEKKAKTRVGRGDGSKGKTAGRGTKGTKARKNVPATFEGGQMPIHMRLPKLKGFGTASAPSTTSSMSATSTRRSPRAAPSASTSWSPRAWSARTSWSRCSVTASWPPRSTSPRTSSAAAPARRSPPQAAPPPSCDPVVEQCPRPGGGSCIQRAVTRSPVRCDLHCECRYRGATHDSSPSRHRRGDGRRRILDVRRRSVRSCADPRRGFRPGGHLPGHSDKHPAPICPRWATRCATCSPPG